MQKIKEKAWVMWPDGQIDVLSTAKPLAVAHSLAQAPGFYGFAGIVRYDHTTFEVYMTRVERQRGIVSVEDVPVPYPIIATKLKRKLRIKDHGD